MVTVIIADKAEIGTDWLEPIDPATTAISMVYGVSNSAGCGVLGASRTSDSTSPNFSQACFSLGGFAFHDNPNKADAAYGGYFESWFKQAGNALGFAQGIEIAIINEKDTAPSTNPYSINPAGLSEGLRIGAGKGNAGKSVSQAQAIVNATASGESKFLKGIVFGSDSLKENIALAMAQPHLLCWYSPDQNIGMTLRSDVTDSSQGIKIIGANNLFAVQNVSGTNPLLLTMDGTMFIQKGNDGTLMNFTVGGLSKGSIAVKNGFVSYNTFTGSHWGAGDIPKDTLPGSILVSTDSMYDKEKKLPEVALSLNPNDGAAYGVFSHFDEDGRVNIYSLGTGFIRVSGDDINVGDLITSSSIPGVGERQHDNIVRSYTVAKARESFIKARDGEEKTIACTLLAG